MFLKEKYSGCQKNESSLIFVMKIEIRLHLEFLTTQTCTFGPQICTLGTQTCTLCFRIAFDIFASTFLPNALTTLTLSRRLCFLNVTKSKRFF